MSRDYSQSGEQPLILAHFGARAGRFLDIGAHNGRSNSNTIALAELGWSGTCVEPSPRVFAQLAIEHRERPQIDLVCAAIDSEPGLCRFFDSGGDQVSTLRESHRDHWARVGVKFQELWTPRITWSELLHALPGPYEFASIDAESATLAILQDAPLDDIGAELLCVEKEDPPVMRAWFAAHGWTHVHETRENYVVSR